MGRYDSIEFFGEMKSETKGAYLVSDGINEVWLPKSQVKEMRQLGSRGDEYEFKIPEWLAKKKGVI